MNAPATRGQMLFVCSGNTCRSPLAEALARRHIAAHELPCTVTSAGVSAREGAPASEQARHVAAESGLDLNRHRAQLLTRSHVTQAALVLVMSAEHRDFIRVLAPEALPRVQLLRDYAEGSEAGTAIRDPFGGDTAAYRRTLEEIKPLVERSLQRFCADATSRR